MKSMKWVAMVLVGMGLGSWTAEAAQIECGELKVAYDAAEVQASSDEYATGYKLDGWSYGRGGWRGNLIYLASQTDHLVEVYASESLNLRAGVEWKSLHVKVVKVDEAWVLETLSEKEGMEYDSGFPSYEKFSTFHKVTQGAVGTNCTVSP